MTRPVYEVLEEIRAGQMLKDLGDELAVLLAAIRATGSPGELRLVLKLKPPKDGPPKYLTIEDAITSKRPQIPHGDTVFFVTAENGLTRQAPSQVELELGSVTVIDTNTGEVLGTVDRERARA